MFDALVQELANRFDLAGKAPSLVNGVLTYLFQEQPGGLNGFLDRFRKAGMGDLVNSWIGSTAPRELTMGQLDGALGGSLVEQLASKAGLSVSKVKPALALLLPRLIGMLTAGGVVPTTIPPAVSSWLGGTGARVVGTYREEPVRAPVAATRSVWPWLLPLLALGALALWFLWPTAPAVPPPVATTQPAPTSAPTAAPATTAPTGTTDLWPAKIYFATDSKVIAADDTARIQRVAEYLKTNPGVAVDITGFTDKTGASATNLELAKERAKAVRSALVAAGVAETRTNLAPPATVTGATNDAEARRVEIRPKS